MAKKIAIDWDENELRLVAAQCSGANVKVTDAAVLPIEPEGVMATLRNAITRRSLESTDALIAIGRGKAELRELQLPPVPDEELPDMVRFQAIRSFASAGDRATVDYLVTNRSESGVEMIAAAVGPDSLAEVRETCESSNLSVKRIGLRPLAAAALYLARKHENTSGEVVLIDLLSDDAEIVVARDGKVIFVRTVRMPSGLAARPKALAGELRRSLVACGSTGTLSRVVLWGLESVHQEDVAMLSEAAGTEVVVLDPFDLVDVDRKMQDDMPEHVGRLAPLVGLIASDELHADRLIDFLNPRERIEETESPLIRGLLIGLPIAVALLLAFFAYRHLKNLDREIAMLQSTNANMQPDVDRAVQWVARTEEVDLFLDTDVNWLDELRRLAKTMPPSDQMILTGLVANTDARRGGGTMTITGAVTDPNVMKDFEEALRDESHRVIGDESTEQKTKDAYKWTVSESITVLPEAIRNTRYENLAPVSEDAQTTADTETDEPSNRTQPEEADPPDESPPDAPEPDSPADTVDPSSAEDQVDAGEAKQEGESSRGADSEPGDDEQETEQPETDAVPADPAELVDSSETEVQS